ncbi:MAG: hypothetical protein ACLFPL_00085 [Candidatus Nanoarchaeia archaeon]
MVQMVSIPQEEYLDFLKFKKVVKGDFTVQEELEFLENTLKAQKEYDKGEFTRVDSSKLDEFLDSM